jgi:hypothetical protein
MPIRPFLADQAFEPELIRQMSLALETVCETLRLGLTDDPNTRLVASKTGRIKDCSIGAARRARCPDAKRNDAERIQALLTKKSPRTAEQLPHDWLSGTIDIAITEDPPCRDG